LLPDFGWRIIRLMGTWGWSPEVVFEALDTALVLVDRNGQIVYANAHIGTLLGYDPDDLCGRSVDVLFPEELQEFLEAFSESSPRSSIDFSMDRIRETVARQVDGSKIPVEVTLGRIGSQADRYLMCTLRDCSPLLEKKPWLDAIVDAMPGVFYVFDDQQRLVRWNQALENELGYPHDALFMRKNMDFVHEDDRQWLAEEVLRIYREDDSSTRHYRILTSEGRSIRHAGNGVVTEIGGRKFMVGLSIDTTELWELQQELKDRLDEIEELKRRLEAENLYLRSEVELSYEHCGIVGESRELQEVLAQVEQVAPTDSTVLITGETGTGKELIAQRIHEISRRSDRSMIRINCAALPPTLIEAELFGHEKGAYTGAASDRVGRFEIADGSTLFLDKVGELPLELQAKLLRVLESGEIERVGSSRIRNIDVRVIAATNRNLEEATRHMEFRKDLFYRLNVFPIHVPPLRERREDIPLLVRYLVNKLGSRVGKTVESISKHDMMRLEEHPWSGNVRELRNVIERSLIISQGPGLTLALPGAEVSETEFLSLDEAQRSHICRVLGQTGGRVGGPGGAAEILKMKPTTLRSKMKRLGIQAQRDATLFS
jgi:PAS domain S-box-containing protein